MFNILKVTFNWNFTIGHIYFVSTKKKAKTNNNILPFFKETVDVHVVFVRLSIVFLLLYSVASINELAVLTNRIPRVSSV